MSADSRIRVWIAGHLRRLLAETSNAEVPGNQPSQPEEPDPAHSPHYAPSSTDDLLARRNLRLAVEHVAREGVPRHLARERVWHTFQLRADDATLEAVYAELENERMPGPRRFAGALRRRG